MNKIKSANQLKKVVMFLILAWGLVSLAYAQAINVMVDGRALALDQPAVMYGGRVMVPLRGIFESLGASVKYDALARSIVATRNGQEVTLSMNSRAAFINGQPQVLDVPPLVLHGRALVPLRFVSQSLGARVDWNAAARTVDVLSLTGGANLSLPTTGGLPRIDRITVNAPSLLQPGQAITVYLQGEPGGVATFDIVNVASDIPMRETSPGQYEGTYVAQAGMPVSQAQVIGHLQARGLESQLTANQMISITGDLASRMRVFPPPGSELSSTRPRINAIFPSTIRPNSVNLWLDSSDYTSLVQLSSNNAITFDPSFALSPGEHVVTVTATGLQGEQFRRRWNFFVTGSSTVNANLIQSMTVSPRSAAPGQPITVTVLGTAGGTATMRIGNQQNVMMTETSPGTYVGTYPAPGSYQGQSADVTVNLQMPNGQSQTLTNAAAVAIGGGSQGSVALNVTSPGNNNQVSRTFDITGNTDPNSVVKLRLLTNQNGILGNVLGLQQELLNTQTTADANGYFVFHVDTGNLSSGSRITALLQSQNPSGAQSSQQQITLTKR